MTPPFDSNPSPSQLPRPNDWEDAAQTADFLGDSFWNEVEPQDYFTALKHWGIASGATIDGYELESELGSGGSGIVYRALRREPVERVVAIKFLLNAEALRGQVARAERERQVLSELAHPGVAGILDAGKTPSGVSYIVMPLILGKTIDRHCQDTSCNSKQIASLMERVARAVEHVHQRKILHRDINPNNVMVQPDGQPVVMDFGTARWMNKVAPRTVTGMIVGTLGYIAPEQCGADASSDFETTVDVYGIGATLYRLLTGRPPYREATTLQTMAAMQSEQITPPRRLSPQVPVELEAICLKCLARNPADRYTTVGELGDDLQRFVNDLPVRAKPLTWPRRLVRWSQRYPLTTGLAATLLLTLCLGFAITTGLWFRASLAYEDARGNLELASQIARETTMNAAAKLSHSEKELIAQEALLAKGREFYRAILARNATDIKLRNEYATACYQHAAALHNLGRFEESVEAREAALAEFTRLSKAYPQDAKWQFDVFHCQWGLFPDYFYIGRKAKSIAIIPEALQTLKRVVAMEPTNGDYLDAYACVLCEMATLKSGIEYKPKDGARFANEALSVATSLVARPDCKPMWRRHLGTAHARLAEIALHENDAKRSQWHAEQALAVAQRLCNEVTDANDLFLEVYTYTELKINALLAQKKVTEASAALEEIAPKVREYHAQRPTYLAARQYLERLELVSERIKKATLAHPSS